MSRCCVLGAGGMLGSALVMKLVDSGHEVTSLSHAQYDVAVAEVDTLSDALADSVVINCVALPPGRPLGELIPVNATFPRRLAAQCRKSAARLIHISTNGVFSGRRGPYSEECVPDAVDDYGVSKYLGEDPSAMVLRTSIIGVERTSNKYLLNWALSQQGQTIGGFVNHLWNGVTTDTLADLIENLIARDSWIGGVHHVTSPDVVSKYELLEIIRDAYDIDLQINPVRADEDQNRTLCTRQPLVPGLLGKSVREQVQDLVRKRTSF